MKFIKNAMVNEATKRVSVQYSDEDTGELSLEEYHEQELAEKIYWKIVVSEDTTFNATELLDELRSLAFQRGFHLATTGFTND